MKRVTLLLTACITLLGCGDDVKVGDEWLYEYTFSDKDRSPFPDCDDHGITHIKKLYTVLEIKDGWIKSVDENGIISCDREYVFKVGAKKLSGEK